MEHTGDYLVVINDEEQYSIWPADRAIPAGWRAVGKQGLKDECLDYVEEVWTDMRPKSVREALAEMERSGSAAVECLEADDPAEPDLVSRLSEGWHRVEVVLRPERTTKAFADCIGRRYVSIKFTETRGGTELGFQLNADETNLDGADLEKGTGRVLLAGPLRLDGVSVRCEAEIEVAEMTGRGRLCRV